MNIINNIYKYKCELKTLLLLQPFFKSIRQKERQNMPRFEYQKSAQLINFFAQKSGNKISKLKTYKLVWLVNRLHLQRYGRTVTMEVHVAMEHGPVPSSTKDYLESEHSFTAPVRYYKSVVALADKQTILSKSTFDESVFSRSELGIMNEIWESYGSFLPWQLREHSHLFPEWKRFEKKLAKQNTSFPMIADDYFTAFDDGKGLFGQEEEVIQFMKEEYLENC